MLLAFYYFSQYLLVPTTKHLYSDLCHAYSDIVSEYYMND